MIAALSAFERRARDEPGFRHSREARALLGEALGHEADPVGRCWIARTLGLLQFAAGEPERAWRTLEIAASGPLPPSALAGVLAHIAKAALEIGDAAHARRMAAEALILSPGLELAFDCLRAAAYRLPDAPDWLGRARQLGYLPVDCH